ncbi:inorganic pyrophosphatase [Fulvivirgaceae bacterium BMA10]|uniref:inorganic diphosphatase n=1 Tax=Splendidivirga corallicola TaxID=3051826 RepID=A0ABT8KJY1_9BACT|nr:inorganic pyrophosphatase [Fulvivirgaceae bacterium BMA10]
MGLRYKSHPWHGLDIGNGAPELVTCFIEIVPTDTVKYEIDKVSGYMKIDRPQKFSNTCPALYGFVPQTFCAESVAEFSNEKLKRSDLVGDSDPLDICVLTERPVAHGNILVEAIPIGGLRMIDQQEADDKIIAVLKEDMMYGSWKDIADCPKAIINRLKHYFLTYKQAPGQDEIHCEIPQVYGRDEAHEVIERSVSDYKKRFGHLEAMLSDALE